MKHKGGHDPILSCYDGVSVTHCHKCGEPVEARRVANGKIETAYGAGAALMYLEAFPAGGSR